MDSTFRVIASIRARADPLLPFPSCLLSFLSLFLPCDSKRFECLCQFFFSFTSLSLSSSSFTSHSSSPFPYLSSPFPSLSPTYPCSCSLIFPSSTPSLTSLPLTPLYTPVPHREAGCCALQRYQRGKGVLHHLGVVGGAVVVVSCGRKQRKDLFILPSTSRV